MPDALLPIFPQEATSVNRMVSVVRREGTVYYFIGMMPFFSHAENDHAAFRLITSQLVVNDQCTEAELGRAFGVSRVSLCRYVKKLREGGPEAFFRPRRRRGGSVLDDATLAEAQALFDEGTSMAEVAAELEIAYDTVRKAVKDGRLRQNDLAKKNATRD